jgi:hypothetical protein
LARDHIGMIQDKGRAVSAALDLVAASEILSCFELQEKADLDPIRACIEKTVLPSFALGADVLNVRWLELERVDADAYPRKFEPGTEQTIALDVVPLRGGRGRGSVYGWTGQQSGSGFSDRPRPALGVFASSDRL